MTVMERLRAAGAGEDEAQRAAGAIGAALPVDRTILVTEDVLEAARRGDLALVAVLLAEEVEVEADELEALEELARDPERGQTLSDEQVRLALGLKPRR